MPERLERARPGGGRALPGAAGAAVPGRGFERIGILYNTPKPRGRRHAGRRDTLGMGQFIAQPPLTLTAVTTVK